ncbi:FXYD domain-containing ion transport regulator 6-like isoform X2 [Xenopus laevis]|uniref:FXYD domain-containing ion transport regulator n=1 Tax=Xenopus laevis TaxID=8355 RepID=A0A8J1L831_XENLA|nr:FXYD domain-containing ion transport regulator 6-like isoform X2 [Xenopus laevis]
MLSTVCKSFILTLCICWALAADGALEHNRFHYDDYTLRMGGLIFAGLMLTIGIIVLIMHLVFIQPKLASKPGIQK